MAIFASEYLQNNNQLTCKTFKSYFVFTILGNMETLKTRVTSIFFTHKMLLIMQFHPDL